jgi:hypothetical protein
MSPDGEKPPSQSGGTAEDDQTSSTKSDPKSLEEAEKPSVKGHSFPDGGRDAWTVSNQILSLGCHSKFLQVVAGAWLAVFISFGFLNAFGGTPFINFIHSPCRLIFDPSARLERSVRFYSSRTSSIQLLTLFSSFQAYYKSHQLAHKSESDIAWIGAFQTFWYVLDHLEAV